MHAKKKILAVVQDLMFVVKINEAAKRLGFEVTFVKTSEDALVHAKEHPALIIMDLNLDAVQPVRLIGKIKDQSGPAKISVIGYLSHLQAELKAKAQEAGADMVMARSAFSQNIAQILKRHATVL